jgi:gas vesicle protein
LQRIPEEPNHLIKEAEMNKFVNFVAGAALGALVGAATAILLAPVSGEDLQAQIKDQVEQIQLEVKTAATDRRAELEAQLSNLREPRPAP